VKLAEKIALITGAGSGIGRASAMLFAKEGAKVIITDINPKTGNKTVDRIRNEGQEVLFIQADVAKATDVEKMIKFVTEKHGRIDILYNNAGIPMVNTPVENVPEELWDRIMSVNLKSIYLAARTAIPIMKAQGRGVILNTASIMAVRPRSGYCAYAASKAAVITLTKELALEVASYKIRVNCICPVAVETPMFAGFHKNVDTGREAAIATIPLGRLAQAEDVANAALFLASDDASMITGEALFVDGGRGI
jgi:3-oxoacyl-[acyl-carrier protein] reductase